MVICREHQGPAIRLDFAVRLSSGRDPGILRAADVEPSALRVLAPRIKAPIDAGSPSCHRANG